MPPAKSTSPEGTPAPGPGYGAAPAPAPTNTQPAPDSGFKRRGTKGPTQPQPGAPPERAALPAAPAPQGAQPNVAPQFTPGFQPAGPSAHRLQDLQKRRTQRTDEGGKRTIIEEPDNRVIVKQDNRVFVRHDETGRLATRADNVHSQRRPDGTTETIIVRPGGVQVFNVVDGGGRLVRRYRRDDRGREINIIDNRRFYQGAAAGIAIAAGIGIAADVLGLHLGPPRIGIPRERYIVDYDRASDDDIYETLTAPPVDRLDRAYSLEEIRYNVDLRDRMRRIDLDTINFDFGAWDVSPQYYNVLARIAAGMNRAIDRNPGEVFLIEGYTDAVGSDIDNLSLSDRRAQSVAEILTEDFDVPPENIVTQGYGEEYLKIPTPGPERINRRVAVRRITPLMAHDDYRQ
jgi:outer membrane protein OmpA-like peptidoglycan-associated protein